MWVTRVVAFRLRRRKIPFIGSSKDMINAFGSTNKKSLEDVTINNVDERNHSYFLHWLDNATWRETRS